MDIIDMPEGPAALTGATVAKGERLHWGARTYVVGVINVTPDSFSGDGLGSNVLAAVEQALRFEGEGADILDVGAESTRPGHQQVSEAEELARLLPPLEAIADRVSHSRQRGHMEGGGRRGRPGGRRPDRQRCLGDARRPRTWLRRSQVEGPERS